MLYDCSCGKKHKSRTTVLKHKKKSVHSDVQMNVQTDSGHEPKSGQKNGQQTGRSFLKEINLKGEFEKMAEKINPKKEDPPKDPKYECGACGQKFNEKYSRCPHCGVEFE